MLRGEKLGRNRMRSLLFSSRDARIEETMAREIVDVILPGLVGGERR
jgi:hypothetical protein